MQNEILFFGAAILTLSCVLLMYRLYGKNGLYVYAVFGTLLGNIAVCKCITLFGLETTGGNILYASTFLITDILSERYGKKEAERAVGYSFAAMLLWLGATQVILHFIPSANDGVQDSLSVIFGLTPRVILASLAGFLVSQRLDVFLYHTIWRMTGGGKKHLWLRNNGGTLLSQAADTMIFTTLAFWGRYPGKVFVSILLTTYLFKALVALLDTPFVYLARKISPREKK